MRRVTAVRPEESIAQGRLIGTDNWTEEGTRLGVFLIFGLPLLIILWHFPYSPTRLATTNERIAAYALLAPLAVGLSYVLYRAVTEKQLWKVRTSYSQAANQALILQFLNSQPNYSVKRASRNVIVALDYLDADRRYGKTCVFLPTDKTIHFCVLSSRPRLNLPALVTPWLLRTDLAKATRTALPDTDQPPQPTEAD